MSPQQTFRWPSVKLCGGRAEHFQRGADLRKKLAAIVCDCQSACLSLEQSNTETRFQGAYLLADGGLSQAEFIGCRSEIQVACRGFERAKPVQRG